MRLLKLVLVLSFLYTAILAQDSISVGISNRYGDLKRTQTAFAKTIEALNQNSKLKWKLKIYNKEEDLIPALEKQEIQIIKMSPLTYALKKQSTPIKAIAISLNKTGSPHYTSTIVVYKKSDITNLQQLKGKKIAFGSKYSTSSFLVAASYLERIGIKLSDIDYKFLGAQPKILLGIQKGEFDAGAVISDLLNNARPGTFRVLHRSEPIPGSPIIVSKKLPQGLVDSIKKDLRKFNRYMNNNPDIQSQIEGDFKYGFTLEVNENIFDPLRLAYKKILPKIK